MVLCEIKLIQCQLRFYNELVFLLFFRIFFFMPCHPTFGFLSKLLSDRQVHSIFLRAELIFHDNKRNTFCGGNLFSIRQIFVLAKTSHIVIGYVAWFWV